MIPVTYNLRNLAVRKTTTAAAALGIALVVFVIASVLMLRRGVERAMGQSGRTDNAIVLRKGSDAELSSTLEESQVGMVLATPGVKRHDQGAGLGMGEVVVVITQEKIGASGISNVQVRGVTDLVMAFRPETHIIEGRAARPGTDEVVIGKRIRGRFKGVDLHESFEIRKNRQVKVVGVFEAGGSTSESEIWADLDTVRSSFGREGLVSSVRVRLESPAKFDAFQAAVEQDKQLGLTVMREDVFFQKQSEGTSKFVTILGILIAVFFSVGAMIGAMITMYASVANRQREVGVLRALGFSRFAILTSFLFESTVLALGGAVLGAICSLGMGAVHFSMLNMASWSEIVFSFTPTVGLLVYSMLVGGGMGLLGGFLPAVRAARVSPVSAMRG